jgi:hypothetical protein
MCRPNIILGSSMLLRVYIPYNVHPYGIVDWEILNRIVAANDLHPKERYIWDSHNLHGFGGCCFCYYVSIPLVVYYREVRSSATSEVSRASSSIQYATILQNTYLDYNDESILLF